MSAFRRGTEGIVNVGLGERKGKWRLADPPFSGTIDQYERGEMGLSVSEQNVFNSLVPKVIKRIKEHWIEFIALRIDGKW